jgi:hypothetical protein
VLRCLFDCHSLIIEARVAFLSGRMPLTRELGLLSRDGAHSLGRENQTRATIAALFWNVHFAARAGSISKSPASSAVPTNESK